MSDRDWLDLTDEQVRAAAVAEAAKRDGFGAAPPSSHRQKTRETMAALIQRLYRVVLRPMARAADPRQATGFWLQLHGINAGVPFRAARAARGYAHVSSAAGGTLPAGAEIQAGGQAYTADSEVTLDAGVAAAVAVTAAEKGAAGNVAAGAEAQISGEGVPADAEVSLRAGWITIYGHDADDLSTEAGTERYRVRVLAGYAVRGETNTFARYRLAALGVPGVSDALPVRTPRSYGSADLAVLVEGRLPTQAELELVEAAVDEDALVCRDLWVRAPSVVTAVVDAQITGTAAASAVEAAIEAWWRTRIGIGDAVLVQDLYAAVDVDGLASIVYSSPATNLAAKPSIWYEPQITVRAA